MYHFRAQSIAAQHLSKSAYLLWEYLIRNKNGMRWRLSYKALNHWFPMSEKTYRRAKQELVREGYMVEQDKKNGIYNFYEYPNNIKPAEEEGAWEDDEELTWKDF